MGEIAQRYLVSRRVTLSLGSGGEADFDLLASERRANSTDHFRGPEFLTEQDERAFLEIANRAEIISREGGVIRINPVAWELTFEGWVAIQDIAAGAPSKRLSFKSLEKRLENCDWWRGNDDYMRVRLPKTDSVTAAILADAVQVTEKIEGPGLVTRYGGKDAAPNSSGIRATNRLVIFVIFGQFEPNGADIFAQIERLNFENVHERLFQFLLREMLLKIG